MLFSQILSAYPRDRVCLGAGEKSLTYGELDDKSSCLAKRLACTIKKGDKVFMRLTEPHEQLIAFFAIVKAGGVCVFADCEMKEELCARLKASYGIEHDFSHLVLADVALDKELPVLCEADIFLGVFSSGSTGRPKLILRDQQSWLDAFAHQSELFNISGEARLYLVGSLAYSANLNACLHVLSEGGSVFFAKSKLPRVWRSEIEEKFITALFMVPANYRVFVKSFQSVNERVGSVVTGGAKMDAPTVAKLRERFPRAEIVEYYGASELGHVSYAKNEEIINHPDSVGRLFPGVKARIVDDVIWISSPYLAPACRPEATAGDLGQVGEDGFLRLAGRRHDVINVAGIKISCREVERVLNSCLGIAEAAVLGVPDEIKGEKLCAFAVREEERIQARDVLRFCRDKLDRFSCPQKIIFIEKIPLNISGKVDKVRLKQMAASEEIKNFLPQREPFLFVDEILQCDKDEIITRYSYNEDFIFAQKNPLTGGKYVPAVILLESLVQSGGAGINKAGRGRSGIFVLASLDKVKIRGEVKTPATVTMKIKTQKAGGRIIKQSGSVYLGERFILSASWCCILG